MITWQNLHTTFGRIIDEAQTFDFTPEMMDDFLNQAQLWLFKKLYSPDARNASQSGVDAYLESNQKLAEYLSPFIQPITGFASNVIEKSIVSGALGREVFTLSGIEVKYENHEFVPVKWKSYAEVQMQQRLPFFTPDVCQPVVTINETGYVLYPSGDVEYRANALVYPVKINYISLIDSEFGEIFANVLPYKAAQLAGISIRDKEFAQSVLNELEVIGV